MMGFNLDLTWKGITGRIASHDCGVKLHLHRTKGPFPSRAQFAFVYLFSLTGLKMPTRPVSRFENAKSDLKKEALKVTFELTLKYSLFFSSEWKCSFCIFPPHIFLLLFAIKQSRRLPRPLQQNVPRRNEWKTVTTDKFALKMEGMTRLHVRDGARRANKIAPQSFRADFRKLPSLHSHLA